MTYALDTNTISYFIQENINVINNFRCALLENNDIIIPPVTYYELRRGFKHKPSPKKEKAFIRLCELYSIGEMNIETWELASDIYADTRKAGKAVDDTDILIAAFSIVNGYTLVTSNTKHFKDINDIVIVDWTEELIK